MACSRSDLDEALYTAMQSVELEGESTSNIGGNFNHWKKPVFAVGPSEGSLEHELQCSQFVGNVNFNKQEWAKARRAAEAVLELILKEMKKEATKKYQGLVIQKYIRKGSSREGLKTREPDEFDVLLQFHIEGLRFQHAFHESGSGHVIEFGEIRIQNSMSELQSKFPAFHRVGAFIDKGGRILLSSMVLHEKVFESLVDKAVSAITSTIENNEGGRFPFKITRKRNPPAINIKIQIRDSDVQNLKVVVPEARFQPMANDVRVIDVDIVPGLLIRRDHLPNPLPGGGQIECPTHFIFRWMTKEQNEKAEVHPDIPEALWRISTTGFEAYLFDISQNSDKGRYIMTAMRVLKTYLSKTKELYQEQRKAPPPITTVLASYHLKHIVLYCIHFLANIPLQGVKEAIGYIVDLLQVSLEEKKLPHFFRRNESLRGTFPDYTYSESSLAYDFFGRKPADAREQARLSLDRDLRVHMKDFIQEGRQSSRVKELFRQFIRSRKYFQGARAPYGLVVDMHV